MARSALIVNRGDHLLFLDAKDHTAAHIGINKNKYSDTHKKRVPELTDQWQKILSRNDLDMVDPKDETTELIGVSVNGKLVDGAYVARIHMRGLSDAQRLVESFYLAYKELKKDNMSQPIYSCAKLQNTYYVIVPEIEAYSCDRFLLHHERSYRHASTTANHCSTRITTKAADSGKLDLNLAEADAYRSQMQSFMRMGQYSAEKEKKKTPNPKNWRHVLGYPRVAQLGVLQQETHFLSEDTRLLFDFCDRYSIRYDHFDPKEDNPFLYGNGKQNGDAPICEFLKQPSKFNVCYFKQNENGFAVISEYISAIARLVSELPPNPYIENVCIVSRLPSNKPSSFFYSINLSQCLTEELLKRPAIRDLLRDDKIKYWFLDKALLIGCFSLSGGDIGINNYTQQQFAEFLRANMAKKLESFPAIWEVIRRECALVSASLGEDIQHEVDRPFSPRTSMPTVWTEAARQRFAEEQRQPPQMEQMAADQDRNRDRP